MTKIQYDTLVELADQVTTDNAYDVLPLTDSLGQIKKDIADAAEIIGTIDEEGKIPASKAIALAETTKAILLFLQHREIKLTR